MFLSKVLLALTFTAIFLDVSSSIFFKKNDKFIATISYIQTCKNSGPEYNWELNIKTRKFNRTSIGISANATLPEPFGDSHLLDLNVYSWGDGGWKLLISRKEQPACSTLHLFGGQVWRDTLKSMQASLTCPIAAGFYKADDIYLNFTELPFLYRPARIYLKLIFAKRNNKILTCVEGEGEVKEVIV